MPKTTKKKDNKKTWSDPIVDEIRGIREAHAKKFNYDMEAIVEDLKEYERMLKKKKVSRDDEKKPA